MKRIRLLAIIVLALGALLLHSAQVRAETLVLIRFALLPAESLNSAVPKCLPCSVKNRVSDGVVVEIHPNSMTRLPPGPENSANGAAELLKPTVHRGEGDPVFPIALPGRHSGAYQSSQVAVILDVRLGAIAADTFGSSSIRDTLQRVPVQNLQSLPSPIPLLTSPTSYEGRKTP
jgi:hypothetical protein